MGGQEAANLLPHVATSGFVTHYTDMHAPVTKVG